MRKRLTRCIVIGLLGLAPVLQLLVSIRATDKLPNRLARESAGRASQTSPESANPSRPISNPVDRRQSASLAPTHPVSVSTTSSAESHSGVDDKLAPAIQKFRRWAEDYAQETDAAAKQILVEEGKRIALDHRQAILELISTDPRSALRQAVPMVLRQALPPEILSMLESPVNARASFQVYAATLESPEPIRRVVEIGATRYRAYVFGGRSLQTSTQDDWVTGIAVSNVIALDDRPLRILDPRERIDANREIVDVPTDTPEHASAHSPFTPFTPNLERPMVEAGGELYRLCCRGALPQFERRLVAFEGSTGGPVTPSHPIISTASTGAKSILYIRLAFPDVASSPQSEADAYDMMRQVNDWYVENSYGQISFFTTVTPLVTLPRTEDWYRQIGDEFKLQTDAIAAAARMGFDSNTFDLYILSYKGGPGNFGGLANIGSPGAWLKKHTVGVAAHELGHNLGLWHANFWNAGTSAIGAGTNQEYGHVFDTMGPANAGIYQFSTASKNQLGWLTEESLHEIRQSGTYRIYAHDQRTAAPGRRYAMKIRKDSERVYWGEFRQNFGSTNRWLQDGILLNWGPWSKSSGGTQLLDTTPGTPDGKVDAAVTIGRTFSDFESGIHLTPISRAHDGAESIDVVVNLGTFADNQPPSVTTSADASIIETGVNVQLSATASDPDGDQLAYFWDFGDGTISTANLAQVSKSWNIDGLYAVRCLVSDMKGGTASHSVLVRVGSPVTFSISGTVSLDGNALANVHVSNGETGSTYRGSYTDSDGTYTITGLPAGSVSLIATLDGHTFAPEFVDPITMDADVADADFTAQLLPQVSIFMESPEVFEGGTNGVLRIVRTGSLASSLPVKLFGITGSATIGSDFELNPAPQGSAPGTITIPAGQSELIIQIAALADPSIEGPEELVIELAAATSYSITGSSSAKFIIQDADSPLPLVSIDTLDPEASEDGGSASFLISRIGSTSGTLMVQLNSTGSATAGIDFLDPGSTVIIPDGMAKTTLTITPLDDNLVEGSEAITFGISPSGDYLVHPSLSIATIFLSDDDLPTIGITCTDPIAAEFGNDPATFVITRSGDTSTPIEVTYSLTGSAQNGTDYAALPGSLTIPAGSSSASISVVPIDDGIGEPTQTIGVTLLNGPWHFLSESNSASADLIDDDAPVVTVSSNDTASEPSNPGQLTFTTTGSGAGDITIHYSISGSATPGLDYSALPGSLTMGRNATRAITITPLDDSSPEDMETITVSILPDASYTTFLDTSATVNLYDDEKPRVSVAATPGFHNELFGQPMEFYLSREASAATPLDVHYSMLGTATNGSDYQMTTGIATIPAGGIGVTVAVRLLNDFLPEGTETVTLSIDGNPAYGIGSSEATHYLMDDEFLLAQVGFVTAIGSTTEDAGTHHVMVSLSSVQAVPVTVEYEVFAGTATGTNIDYALAAGQITFSPGQTLQNIPLTIVNDEFDEPDQTVILRLQNASGARLFSDFYLLTINDNEEPPAASIGFAAVASSTTEDIPQVPILVSLTAAQTTAISVSYSVTGGTATGGGVDFDLPAGSLVFNPGETVKAITLNVIDDLDDEPDETLEVTLNTPSGATLNANTSHSLSIIDIPATLEVSPEDSLLSEGSAGGPFSPSITTYTLRNTGDTPMSWGVSTDADWLNVSSQSGTLSPGETADIMLSLNAQANVLPPSSYMATASFINSTNGNGNTSRLVALSVLLGAPSLIAEPPFTAGDANRISWEPLPGADFFEVQHSTDPQFAENVVSSELIPGSAMSYDVTGLSDASTYYFRVRGRTGTGAQTFGPWSASESSTQDASAPVLDANPIPAITAQPTIAVAGTSADTTSGVASVSINGFPASTSDGFATWSAMVSPLAPGNNELNIIATDGSDPANQVELNLSVYYATSALDFDSDGLPDDWEFEHGLDLSDDGSISVANGPYGDLDGDGVANLIEFAVDNDPNRSDPLPIESSIEVDPGDGDPYYTITYSRRIDAPGIQVGIETSTDMVNWKIADSENSEQSPPTSNPDGITESVTLRILPSLDDASAHAIFARMNVRIP